MSTYDILIIGSGPGGYVAAIRARQLGLSVGIVERAHLGGICLNWGCIPTKSLLHGTEILRGAKGGKRHGVVADGAILDPVGLLARSREVAGQLGMGVAYLLKKNGVDVIWGLARITAPGAVEVTESATTAPRGALGPGAYTANHVIVATGASPRRGPGLEPDGDRVWTYFEALRPTAIPGSLLIVGSGAIGVEFAGIYAALGTEVTMLEALPRVLPQEDAEVSEAMETALSRQGITIRTGVSVNGLTKGPEGVVASLSDGSALKAERVLSAVGVVANTAGLGLEALGVAMDRGALVTDGVGRTNVPGLHAIGDVAGPPMLAHKAEHDGVRCVEAIARRGAAVSRPGPVPSCVYSHPQVASVGLTEAQADERGITTRIGRFGLRGNGKAMVLGDTEGFAKVLFDAESDRLIGAHLVGPLASEQIHGLTIALTLGATAEQLAGVVFPHPTLSEALHEAILATRGGAIHA
ncbi:MAG: dihydrolipoyl dehydrogenase [Rhodospirillum sp.]|nr:dihydrolipoyl dehydrogenase [Rhodospirillum sp.]MCF8490941.1 dihydrolipoyl dehydrogenase [Rhodospirillum sp.]MCF8502639.1 dihydrolipoyl dehydrogenase [Rhodospirillum sp.]